MANSDLSCIKTATIEWRDNAPFCTEFDDFYYRSKQPFSEHGLKETDYLFIQQNNLSTYIQQNDNISLLYNDSEYIRPSDNININSNCNKSS